MRIQSSNDADPAAPVLIVVYASALAIAPFIWFWIGSHAEYDRLISRM